MKRNVAVKEGLRAAWPICLGYVPIGLAFGVLAQKAGLHPWQTGLMSVLVFAGSAQFAAVAMLEQGASMTAIITATFMINLRHLLMSSAMAVQLRNVKKRFLTLFAYGITDESFAVNQGKFLEGGWDRRPALVVNQTANAVWIGSTVCGAYAGELIPAGAMGIDYALPAMFICLLVIQIRGSIYLLTAVMAGGLALLFRLLIPGNSYVILASLLSVIFAGLLRFRKAGKGGVS